MFVGFMEELSFQAQQTITPIVTPTITPTISPSVPVYANPAVVTSWAQLVQALSWPLVVLALVLAFLVSRSVRMSLARALQLKPATLLDGIS